MVKMKENSEYETCKEQNFFRLQRWYWKEKMIGFPSPSDSAREVYHDYEFFVDDRLLIEAV